MDKNYIVNMEHIMARDNLSQVQLAGILGVTHAALNRWLKGHVVPRKKHIAAIERLFHETISFPDISSTDIQEIQKKGERCKCEGIWDTIKKNQQIQDDLLLEHTYNSTAIEGTTFNKRETENVLFHSAIIQNKSLTEHLEVTNYGATLRALFCQEYKGTTSEHLIKNLHQRTLNGIRPDAGNYAQHQRGIRGVDIILPHPEDIPEEMDKLIATWKRNREITIKEIAQFHADFEFVHPFGDGNGRVGRLIMAYQCLQQNYPPVVIENVNKSEYYDVLEYAQRKSIAPFVVFLFNEMERTCRIIDKYR